MKQERSQIQLKREIKNVSNKLDRLEVEIRFILKKMGGEKNVGLERGLRELKTGKGRLYRSMKEWSAEMKAQA